MTTAALRPGPAMAAEDRRVALLAQGQLSALADLFDDTLIYVHSTGLVQGKADVLEFFAKTLRVVRIERQIERVTEDGHLTSIAMIQTMHATLHADESKHIATRSYIHTLWRLTDGDWRLLHFQSTALPAQ
ncbi:hypothetical protein WM40_11830 [Robbsia andropogonis]|uniref:DUF4440 domain-containing protein n=2 Tax=Robbsia andropogonis TaxID=28092 RepID=A0A0F5K056_9BURK|nr:nuclear transport factor 2 family protein [Robbsia andropogonis]KKB63468.1 hypothetical protein WM40_11830 [Robbsia andropogonis]MCP1130270.1 nuclear transport factor 2 family protein [Robbsia andropogonis]